MLTICITSSGFHFAVDYNGKLLHFREWDATDDAIYYFPLATLVDNGFADGDKNGCSVPFDSVYSLDSSEQRLLGIPSKYPYAMRLRSINDFRSPDFGYAIDYLEHVPDGNLISANREGNVITLPNGVKHLLTEKQWALINLVNRFNETDLEYKVAQYNMREFAKIKRAALDAGVQLDSFLANEEVFAPESIEIELGRDGDALTVTPSVAVADKDQFREKFRRARRVMDQYPLQEADGRRTRVVLDREQQENLRPIRERGCRYDNPDEIKDILEHPTEYFDPAQFNLAQFYSERVIELGFYKPKFYPFVSPYKSQWVAGAEIIHPLNGTTRIEFESFEQLEKFEKCVEEAVEKKADEVEYEDTKIDIDDAKLLAKMGRMQLENPTKPVKVKEDENGRKVLIIEENAEETNFRVGNQTLVAEGKYPLYRNDNLAEPYTLKQHQEEGVAWLQYLLQKRAPGCLMADDMGLGKTLQLLYFIDWHSRTHVNHRPYLIVAPVSLLENWENEYNRFFTDKMKVTVLTSGQVPRQFNQRIIDRMQKCDIILTNYETVRNAQLNFCAVDFDIVVLDEAQKVKTPGTLVTNAVKALKSKFRVAMTGTPVENSLLDLWCIMDFCVPGLLGNAKEFAKKYQHPLKNEDTDLVALGNEIHDRLGIYFMRRLKSDAAKDLPLKHEVKESVEMPRVQDRAYRAVVNEYNTGVQPNMLVTLQGIRSVSEHPHLYDDTLALHEPVELIEDAARLQATVRFLDTIKSKGEKAILFAERKETQKMLQRIVRHRYGYTAKIINGDTPSSSQPYAGKQSRQSAIDDFQSKPGFGVIIMSPVAAGMGLNVTAANHVIHYSRHWNPAKENQATDRAYRIGQDKDVYVYYPMAVSSAFQSFDVTLDDLLSRKTNLATCTIFPTERVEVKPEDFENILHL